MGGGDLTLIAPGEQAVLRWKATRTGVFVYHCIPGGPMIPWHIASGMSGVVMVLPRDGLKDGNGKPLHYDRVYYVGEQDFYASRGFSEPSRCPDCRAARRAERDRGSYSSGGGYESSAPRAPRQMYEAVCTGCGNIASAPKSAASRSARARAVRTSGAPITSHPAAAPASA